jgi:hypothetical protein
MHRDFQFSPTGRVRHRFSIPSALIRVVEFQQENAAGKLRKLVAQVFATVAAVTAFVPVRYE